MSYINHRCSGCLLYIISWGRRNRDRMVVGFGHCEFVFHTS